MMHCLIDFNCVQLYFLFATLRIETALTFCSALPPRKAPTALEKA